MWGGGGGRLGMYHCSQPPLVLWPIVSNCGQGWKHFFPVITVCDSGWAVPLGDLCAVHSVHTTLGQVWRHSAGYSPQLVGVQLWGNLPHCFPGPPVQSIPENNRVPRMV